MKNYNFENVPIITVSRNYNSLLMNEKTVVIDSGNNFPVSRKMMIRREIAQCLTCCSQEGWGHWHWLITDKQPDPATGGKSVLKISQEQQCARLYLLLKSDDVQFK